MAKDIEKQVESIVERNKRVELDKAWETSKTRRALVAAFTYLIVLYFLLTIKAPDPYFNALVPVLAYIASTMSLPFIKRLWADRIHGK